MLLLIYSIIDIVYAYFHLGPIVQTDGDAPADDIMSDHLAGFVLGLDGLAYLGKTGFQLLICLVFIGQTAHQPTALAGNLGWIQRQALLLGHFDGNRLKFFDECGTA